MKRSTQDQIIIDALNKHIVFLTTQLSEVKGEIGCLQRSLNASNEYTVWLTAKLELKEVLS